MKKWMIILLTFVVVFLLPLLLAVFWPHPKEGTPTPPPGPHKAGDMWLADLGGKTTMAMVWCPPGKFLMGSSVMEPDCLANETQHEVTLTRGFWLGKYEVTQGQWQAIMSTNPSGFPREPVVRWKLWKWQVPVWRNDFLVNRWSLPVGQVNWDDCQKFCRKAGGGCRLPTEAEWEYACRAGSTGPFAGTGVLKEMGWYRDNSSDKFHPVGRKKPNAWGLYDMHGNSVEWCQDWWGDSSAGFVTDPTGPATGTDRVSRGGGWLSNASCCRTAFRGRFEPDFRGGNFGFRAAYGIKTDPASNEKKQP
jgi:formylglycine-generating enzyme required for sulfatase activity